MRGLLLVNTSGWYALFSRTERAHAAVKEAIREAKAARQRLVTSDYVIDETVTLVRARAGHKLAIEVGEAIWRRGGAELIEVDAPARETAWLTFRKYDDHDLSFTDCTSAALMRHRGIDDVLTLDAHFHILGFNVMPAK